MKRLQRVSKTANLQIMYFQLYKCFEVITQSQFCSGKIKKVPKMVQIIKKYIII